MVLFSGTEPLLSVPVPVPLTNAQSYPLWLNVVIFIIAGVIVWLSGSRLSRLLGRVSEVTGIEQAVVGMLMLGVLTSLPEIANVITAAHFGNPALAANNLLGSASINLVLLALLDAIFAREALTSLVAQPSTLLQSALCMVVFTLVAVAIVVGDYGFLGVGIWTLIIASISLISFWLSAGYGGRATWAVKSPPASRGVRAQASSSSTSRRPELLRLFTGALVAGGFVLVAGYALSQTGDALAEQTGLGAGLVGFLLIGFATSLPELSSLTTSVRMGRHEMALGEVFGTNFVNVSLLLLADIVYDGGPVVAELGRFEAVSALLGVILTGVYLVGLLERRNPVVLRLGYDSLAVLITFLAGVGLLYVIRD